MYHIFIFRTYSSFIHALIKLLSHSRLRFHPSFLGKRYLWHTFYYYRCYFHRFWLTMICHFQDFFLVLEAGEELEGVSSSEEDGLMQGLLV